MQNEQKNTIWRFAVIFFIILVGFFAVLGRIVYVQTVERDTWLALAEKQKPTYDSIKCSRGNIMDCHGNLLATSMPQYQVIMDTRVAALRQDSNALFKRHIDTLALDLATIIGDSTPAQYKAGITKAFKNKASWYHVSYTYINYLQRLRLEQNPLIKMGKNKSGIIFNDKYRRIKPYGNLASRTIGTIQGDGGKALTGIELEFEEDLRGTNGLNKVSKIGGRMESITVQEAEDGMDVVTTIDANLQDIVETALEDKLKEKKAKWGCCILMEVQTGYIRAIANLDQTSNGEYVEAVNRAVMRVEPGSTFKTISLMAMLNDGLITLEDTVTVVDSVWRYKKVAEHEDSHKMNGIINARIALSASSNIAFAKYVTREYNGSAHKFVQSVGRLGVRDSVYSEIPGFHNPRINPPVNDTVTISKMAYGYSVEMTPMQILMFYNAIANNGRMMRPMLVTAVQKDGKEVRTFEPEVVKPMICRPDVLIDVKSALHDVVWDDKYGTASVDHYKHRKAQSDLVAIAGKTGTAQLVINGEYSKSHHRITFVGYFPEDNPQYTCICMIEDPRGGKDSGMDCGGTVRKIAERVMAYTGCYVYKNGERKLVKR